MKTVDVPSERFVKLKCLMKQHKASALGGRLTLQMIFSTHDVFKMKHSSPNRNQAYERFPISKPFTSAQLFTLVYPFI